MSDELIINVSPVGFSVLKALAKYRFLTTNQMLDLALAKDRGYLGGVLASFLSPAKRPGSGGRKPKEIGELDFGVKVGKGRLPRMYFLTKKGAWLLEDLDPSLAPVSFTDRVRLFSSDYDHRVFCVDFHIALRTWAEANDQELVLYRPYFDWSKQTKDRRPEPATRIRLEKQNIDTDANFLLRDLSGISRLFLFEMVNGRDTGRVIKKMIQIAEGLEEGSINAAFDFEKAIRVLFVFEHERTLELVKGKATQNPWLQKYAQHFFLKSLSEIDAQDVQAGWHRLGSDTPRQDLF